MKKSHLNPSLLYNESTSCNPLSANPTKWSNTLKQFVGKLQYHPGEKKFEISGEGYDGEI